MAGSRGLFRAAILMSPGGRKGWVQDLREQDSDSLTTKEMLANAELLSAGRGCGSTPGVERLWCLRNLSVTELLADNDSYGRFAPGIDGLSVHAVPLHAIREGAWDTEVEVIVGATSCESCAGEGMFVPPGPPRELPDANYTAALNATFGPGRFRWPVNLSPAEVASWYAEYKAKRGGWEALTRIASDNSHACNAHFLSAALLATAGNASVRRYEFRAAGGHPGQAWPGAPHASDLEYTFRTTSPYLPSHLSPGQQVLAERMQELWGEADRLDSSDWPPCTPGKPSCDRVMIFDTPHTSIETEASLDDGSAALHCKFWEEFM